MLIGTSPRGDGRDGSAVGSGGLQQDGDALADTDAHGGDGAPRLPVVQFQGGGEREPGAAGAQRVAEGDGAAVGIDVFGVVVESRARAARPEPARRTPRSARRCRGRQIGQTVAVQQLAGGADRPDAHHPRRHTAPRAGSDPRQRARARTGAPRRPDAISTAAAPSLTPDALPAVTVPPGSSGRSLASACERGLPRVLVRCRPRRPRHGAAGPPPAAISRRQPAARRSPWPSAPGIAARRRPDPPWTPRTRPRRSPRSPASTRCRIARPSPG